MVFIALMLQLLAGLTLPVLVYWFLRHKRGEVLWARVALGVALVVGGIIFGVWFYHVSGFEARHRYVEMKGWVEDGMFGEVTPRSQAWRNTLRTLSVVADGLAVYASRHPKQQGEVDTLLMRICNYVVAEDYYPMLRKPRDWRLAGPDLGYVNIIFGAYKRVTGRETYAELNTELSRALAGSMLTSRYRSLSEGGKGLVYSVPDNSAVLHSLWYFDRNFEGDAFAGVAPEWGAYLQKELLYARSNLICGAFTPEEKCKVLPNGNNTAWLAGWLGPSGLLVGKELWGDYPHFFKEGIFFLAADTGYYLSEDAPPPYNPPKWDVVEGSAGPTLAAWAAARQRSWIDFYQFHNMLMWREWFMSAPPRDARTKMLDRFEKALLFGAAIADW